jgi:L-2-hydroxyglutarate oxidase
MRGTDVMVVGGGIVGLATARELAVVHRLRVVVLEREAKVASHQSGHNSGVVHSGLYYRPESHKAATCVEGRDHLFRYVLERSIPHERCGKVVVAVSEAELPRLDELERRGRANGVTSLERLDAAAIREHEPHAAGLSGLYVGDTGIVDYRAVAAAFADDVRGAAGEVRTGAAVGAIAAKGDGVVVSAGSERLEARFLIACAGLESDRVARLAGLDPGVAIVPFRGDYCELAAGARRLVRHLIYPVPDPDLPFLGVHLTRRIDGSVEAGPNAVLAWRRDGYEGGAFSVRDAASTLAFPGFWRMGRRLLRTGAGEYARSWSRARFVAGLQRLVPEIEERDLAAAGCGIRAQAVDRSGRLVDDFVFAEGERMLHLVNAPSPAATASMALGRRLAERAVARLERAA